MFFVVAFVALVPLPWYLLLAPAPAVDLQRAVRVDGVPPPQQHFYLTDVALQRSTILTAALALLPGYRLVRTETVIPKDVPEPVYERVMDEAMTESQNLAAAVAERAAGYHVTRGPSRYVVARVEKGVPAASVLRAGDEIVAVNGQPVTAVEQIHARVLRLRAGSSVPVVIRRGNSMLHVMAPTRDSAIGTQLGIYVATRGGEVRLPKSVRYTVGDVGGSSGGLMFALDVYMSLRPHALHPPERVAGTGTIDYDGHVGPIEGTVQKLVAAKRVGASIFFCPQENVHDVAGASGIRVIPVRTFADAVDVLRQDRITKS